MHEFEGFMLWSARIKWSMEKEIDLHTAAIKTNIFYWCYRTDLHLTEEYILMLVCSEVNQIAACTWNSYTMCPYFFQLEIYKFQFLIHVFVSPSLIIIIYFLSTRAQNDSNWKCFFLFKLGDDPMIFAWKSSILLLQHCSAALLFSGVSNRSWLLILL